MYSYTVHTERLAVMYLLCVFVLKWAMMELYHAHGVVVDYGYHLLHSGPIIVLLSHLNLELALNSYKELMIQLPMEHMYASPMQHRWLCFTNFVAD